MLKNKYKITLIVVAVIIALVLLFFVGEKIAAGFAAVLGIFGFGKGAVDKKRKEIVEDAADEEKIIDDIKKRSEERKEIAKELNDSDIKNVNKAHKLIEKDNEIKDDIAELRNRLDKLKEE